MSYLIYNTLSIVILVVWTMTSYAIIKLMDLVPACKYIPSRLILSYPDLPVTDKLAMLVKYGSIENQSLELGLTYFLNMIDMSRSPVIEAIFEWFQENITTLSGGSLIENLFVQRSSWFNGLITKLNMITGRYIFTYPQLLERLARPNPL